jgi:hypothetical protein
MLEGAKVFFPTQGSWPAFGVITTLHCLLAGSHRNCERTCLHVTIAPFPTLLGACKVVVGPCLHVPAFIIRDPELSSTGLMHNATCFQPTLQMQA